MNIREFLSTETAKVYFDPELDTLFLKYQNKVKNEQEFIHINSVVLEAFKSLSTQNFVADIRKMGIISVNSQKWVLDNLLPGMIKHLNGKRLFHAQLLDPSEIFSKVSAANIKNKSKIVDKDFDIIQFSNEDELTEYLISLKKTT